MDKYKVRMMKYERAHGREVRDERSKGERSLSVERVDGGAELGDVEGFFEDGLNAQPFVNLAELVGEMGR